LNYNRYENPRNEDICHERDQFQSVLYKANQLKCFFPGKISWLYLSYLFGTRSKIENYEMRYRNNNNSVIKLNMKKGEAREYKIL